MATTVSSMVSQAMAEGQSAGGGQAEGAKALQLAKAAEQRKKEKLALLAAGGTLPPAGVLEQSMDFLGTKISGAGEVLSEVSDDALQQMVKTIFSKPDSKSSENTLMDWQEES